MHAGVASRARWNEFVSRPKISLPVGSVPPLVLSEPRPEFNLPRSALPPSGVHKWKGEIDPCDNARPMEGSKMGRKARERGGSRRKTTERGREREQIEMDGERERKTRNGNERARRSRSGLKSTKESVEEREYRRGERGNELERAGVDARAREASRRKPNFVGKLRVKVQRLARPDSALARANLPIRRRTRFCLTYRDEIPRLRYHTTT